jgi:hypothetical protein
MNFLVLDDSIYGPDTRYQWKPVDDPTHPDLLALVNYWRLREADGGLVVGRHLPSREIKLLLSNMMLLEPVDGEQDFKIRLAGTSMQRRFGREIAGLNVSAILKPEDFASRRSQINEVLASGKPVYCEATISRGNIVALRSEFGILPVLAPDTGARWALVGIFYHKGSGFASD